MTQADGSKRPGESARCVCAMPGAPLSFLLRNLPHEKASLNAGRHIRLCYIGIRNTFWLETAPRTGFVFYFHTENQSGLLRPQRACFCKIRLTLAASCTLFSKREMGQRRSVTPSLTHCRCSTNTLSEQINNDFHLVRRSSAPGTSHILCRHPNDPGKGVSFPFLQMRKVGGQTGYMTFAQTQRAANEAPCR